MTNIKILEISEIQVDDYFLEELARYCPKLTYINLCTHCYHTGYCNDISDSAILKLLENLPRLERIHIQNTNITERTQAILFHALNARRMDNVVLEWVGQGRWYNIIHLYYFILYYQSILQIIKLPQLFIAHFLLDEFWPISPLQFYLPNFLVLYKANELLWRFYYPFWFEQVVVQVYAQIVNCFFTS